MSMLFKLLTPPLSVGEKTTFGTNFYLILEDIAAGLSYTFGIFFYMLSYVFFLIIDFLSIIFKTVLGLGVPYTIDLNGPQAGVEEVSGDLVLTIIQSQTIQNIFWSLSIIALFLLIISTIVAIIRSEYKWDKEGNSKGPIWGKAIRAIVLYFTVPVACVFGIWISSMLLKAVDEATGSDSGYMSSMVFSICALQGNRVRNDDTWSALKLEYEKAGNSIANTTYAIQFNASPSNFSGDSKTQQENLAQQIDGWFANAYGIKSTEQGIDFNAANTNYYEVGVCDTNDLNGIGAENVKIFRQGFRDIRHTNTNLFSNKQVATPYNINLVWFYYNLFPVGGYNHVLSILVCFLLVKILFDLACGVAKRVYELVVLYCISPPVVALMPLDNGNAYQKWVQQFIGKTLMAFGGVLAINFFFMLVPILKSIKIFNAVNLPLGFFGGPVIVFIFNGFTQLLFVLAGAFSLSSLSKMISDIIGAQDAADSGKAISGAVGEMGGKVAGLATSGALGAAKLALGTVAKGGKLGVKTVQKIKSRKENELTTNKEELNKQLDVNNNPPNNNTGAGNNLNQTTPSPSGNSGGSSSGGKKDKKPTALGRLGKAAASLYLGQFGDDKHNAMKGFTDGYRAGNEVLGAAGDVVKGVVKSGTAVVTFLNNKRKTRKMQRLQSRQNNQTPPATNKKPYEQPIVKKPYEKPDITGKEAFRTEEEEKARKHNEKQKSYDSLFGKKYNEADAVLSNNIANAQRKLDDAIKKGYSKGRINQLKRNLSEQQQKYKDVIDKINNPKTKQ